MALSLDVVGGVPYVAMVLIGIWFPQKWHIFALAVIGSFLTLLGYFLSPSGDIAWVVLTNRGMALFAIWITALLIANYKQKLAISQYIRSRAVREYQRVLTLVLILAAAAVIIAASSIGILYETACKQQLLHLTEVAQTQGRMMEAMARHEQQEDEHENNLESALIETLAQIKDAHNRYSGLGQSEVVLARREGNQISFLLSHSHGRLGEPEPVPINSLKAEPMRRALSGRSGTMEGLDYRGAIVLATYEPVVIFKNVGVIAKIDMSEIRRPFIQAGILATIIAAIVTGLGTALFLFVSNPMIR